MRTGAVPFSAMIEPLTIAPLLALLGGTALLLIAHRQHRLVIGLRRAEAQWRSMLETATDMVLTFDADGRFLTLNHAALCGTGYSSEQLLGVSFQRLIHAEDRVRFREEFRRSVCGERRRFEGRFVHHNGSDRWISCSTTPVTTREGSTTVLVIVRDITERRLAEQELRESEARYRRLVDTAYEGIWKIDVDGRTVDVNERMAELLGTAVQQIVGRDLLSFVPPDQHLEVVRTLTRTSQGERSLIELPLLRADGTLLWALLSSSARESACGAYAGAIVMVTDITHWHEAQAERELLQAELARSHKMRAVGQLVSGVAHELNNPLAAILNFSEQLLLEERTGSDREALQIIHEQARRSRAIVRDLLAVAQRRTDRQREHCTPAALVECVARAQRATVELLGVSMVVDCAPDLPLVEVDRAGIEQVLTNLIVNAAQAASGGGTVTIRTRGARLGVQFLVEDDGPGIPADVHPRLFEPFFTTKPPGDGTGLGLPVSRGIVEQHGGALEGENWRDAERSGARFVVTLPVVGAMRGQSEELAHPRWPVPESRQPLHLITPRPDAQPEEPAAEDELIPVKARVLIVDDEPAIRAALRRFFERRGWDVRLCIDGAEALAILQSAERMEVIVCDLRMPGCSGVELHDHLLATQPELLDRFIFSTGDVASPDAAAFVARTRCPVLQKPFELAELNRAAQEVLAVGGLSAA